MLIIDSLLNFNFLSLWRGAENLSLFSHQAHDTSSAEQSLAPS
jgi:hypothetical protein